MAYEQPNIKIYQEFVPTPTTATQVQYVGVVAPQYGVHEDASLGEYNDTTGIAAVAYPGREEAGSVIDTATASVTMQNGILSYFKDTGAVVTNTNGNKITCSKVLAGVDRDAAFGDRDVQVGDFVRFKVGSSDEYINAKVTAVESVPTAASIGAVTRYGEDSDSFSDSTPTPAVTGTYAGKVSDTYIITITTGGTLGSGTGTVAVSVSTENGSAGFPAILFNGTGTQVLGSTGLVLGLSAGTYAAGAVFTCEITAAGAGALKVLRVDTLIEAAATTALNTVELGAFLDFVVNPGSVVYAESTVAIPAGLVENVALLSTEPADYDVIGGEALISYRERLFKNTKAVQVATAEDYVTVAGNPSEKNPLGAMVSAAISTGGENVYFIALEEDTVAGYNKAFEILAGTPEVYNLVLYSMDKAVIEAAWTFVSAQSAPGVANYRILWYGLDDAADIARYTKTAAGTTILITASAGTVTGGSNVNFESAGVAVGDVLRTNYSTDSDGVVTYDEYAITAVSGNTVTVDGALTIVAPVKAEVWQKLSDNDAVVDQLISEVATTNRRAYAVYGDGITIAGLEKPAQWVNAAAAAGMRAGSYAQAPLTNRTYTATANPVYNFTTAQLNKLAARGIWLIVADNSGVVYNRHQLSTDMSDLKFREQSYTTALDQISTGVKSIFTVYHGVSNISDDLIKQLLADTTTYLAQQVAIVPNVSVGSLLKSFKNLTIYQDPVNLDHLWMSVDYELQAPFNFATITQRVL